MKNTQAIAGVLRDVEQTNREGKIKLRTYSHQNDFCSLLFVLFQREPGDFIQMQLKSYSLSKRNRRLYLIRLKYCILFQRESGDFMQSTKIFDSLFKRTKSLHKKSLFSLPVSMLLSISPTFLSISSQ